MSEKKEKKNIYESISKAGKVVKTSAGYILTIGGTLLLSKGFSFIKNFKK